jgi:hypothetical protein
VRAATDLQRFDYLSRGPCTLQRICSGSFLSPVRARCPFLSLVRARGSFLSLVRARCNKIATVHILQKRGLTSGFAKKGAVLRFWAFFNSCIYFWNSTSKKELKAETIREMQSRHVVLNGEFGLPMGELGVIILVLIWLNDILRG